jgi:uncharacterized membrane protein
MDLKVVAILFLFYTFAGAVAEHLSYFVGKPLGAPTKSLSNPIITGFPIYGLGALIVIWLRGLAVAYGLGVVIEFMIYGVALEILEGVTGVIVGAGSKSYEECEGERCVSSWDYSKSKWNIMGIVDVRHFFLFGIAGMLVSRFNPWLQCKVEKMVASEC